MGFRCIYTYFVAALTNKTRSIFYFINFYMSHFNFIMSISLYFSKFILILKFYIFCAVEFILGILFFIKHNLRGGGGGSLFPYYALLYKKYFSTYRTLILWMLFFRNTNVCKQYFSDISVHFITV